MGYLTQHLIGSSDTFQKKIRMAIENRTDSLLTGSNGSALNQALAKKIMSGGNVDRVTRMLSLHLAEAGYDLDSTDAEIDEGLIDSIDWLIAVLEVSV